MKSNNMASAKVISFRIPATEDISTTEGIKALVPAGEYTCDMSIAHHYNDEDGHFVELSWWLGEEGFGYNVMQIQFDTPDLCLAYIRDFSTDSAIMLAAENS